MTDAALLRAAIAAAGANHSEFGRLIGFDDSGRSIRRVLAGRHGLSGPSRRLCELVLESPVEVVAQLRSID